MSDRRRYGGPLDAVRGRMTDRAFAPYDVPRARRWKKTQFDAPPHPRDAQEQDWIRRQRPKVMYRDETRVE